MRPQGRVKQDALQPSTSSLRPRLESVDLLRGLVMVLMSLDHTRGDFTNVPYYPLDLSQTYPALALTRWVTHLCAPVFFFLAGTSAWLYKSRGKSTGEVSIYLLTRGLWLVFLELTYLNWFAWTFNFSLHWFPAIVIWAIGWSMVVLAAAVWLPLWAVAAFGLAMIALHNAFDAVTPERLGWWGGAWRVLHGPPGAVQPLPGVTLAVTYPLVPWIGVMAAGYAFGPILERAAAARRKWIIGLGVSCVALFVALRFFNLYGDPKPWTAQKDALFTILSFVNCQKYPPSLSFLLMTLGPALLLLAAFDWKTPRCLRPLLVFGRVPLFYFMVHLPLIRGLAVVVNLFRFGRADWLMGPQPQPGRAPLPVPADAGFGLVGIYLIWIGIVLALYPACRWFGRLKQKHRSVWLSYL